MALPIELLQVIFQSFDQQADLCIFSRVCRQWNCLATAMLYRSPVLETKRQIELYCKSSERSRAFVQRLDFSPVSSWLTNDILAALTPYDQNNDTNKTIRSLGFANCNRLSCRTIHTFLLSCSSNQSLDE